MTKFLLVIFFIFFSNVSLSQTVNSENFIYTKVYQCGPKEYDSSNITVVELWGYYLLHFDKFNNVIILNDGIQFKSFEKTLYSDLYYQNGGEQTLNFSKNNNSYIFKLITKPFRPELNEEYLVSTLIFDETNLTYQVRNSRQNNKKETTKTFPITTGFCFKENL
jgi:hypothetical protein